MTTPTTNGVVQEADEDAPGISDADLTALALAADPEAPLDPDAVPLHEYLAASGALLAAAPLPGWYMPLAMARSGSRWRLMVIAAIVVAFVVIEAVGLCSTYGQLGVV
jgi:hypothetical protein